MLSNAQTAALEQAIILLLKLRDEQAQENWEIENARKFTRIYDKKEVQIFLSDKPEYKTAYSIILKEIKKMPRNSDFKEIFNEEWFKKHVRQKKSGIFEIRCMLSGKVYYGAGKTLDIAAKNFVCSFSSASKPTSPTRTQFNVFAEMWFAVVKRPTVKPNTYQSFLQLYTAHIQPYFKGKIIEDLTAMQIQPLFTRLVTHNKTRTAQIVKVLLNQIFRAAVGERLIQVNPMDNVQVLKFESVKGKALLIDEERAFLAALENSEYRLSFLLLLFAGIRRSELASARIEDGFIVVKDGKKRVNQLATERRIPITPMSRGILDGSSKREFRAAINVNPETLTRAFKRLCPLHHLHELRHTFITRCQECGVPREVVSVWAGHAADKTMTSTVYTHFSEEFMLSQGEKVNYFDRLYNS